MPEVGPRWVRTGQAGVRARSCRQQGGGSACPRSRRGAAEGVPAPWVEEVPGGWSVEKGVGCGACACKWAGCAVVLQSEVCMGQRAARASLRQAVWR